MTGMVGFARKKGISLHGILMGLKRLRWGRPKGAMMKVGKISRGREVKLTEMGEGFVVKIDFKNSIVTNLGG